MKNNLTNNIFTFENFISKSDKEIQIILKSVDTSDFILALKGASLKVKAKFFNNMSKNSIEIMEKEFINVGNVKLEDIEIAQAKMIDIFNNI